MQFKMRIYFLLCLMLPIFAAAQKNIPNQQQVNFSSHNQERALVINSLPRDLPEQVVIPITISGERLSLELTKNRVYGKNTRFLISGEDGELVEIDKIEECSYFGFVKEHPNYEVVANLMDSGLRAIITKPNRESLEINPSYDKKRSRQDHTVMTTSMEEESYSCDSNHCCGVKDAAQHDTVLEETPSSDNASVKPPTHSNDQSYPDTPQLKNMGSNATLRPSQVMEVFGYEVGVEIGSRAFLSSDSYNGDMARAQAIVQSLITNLDIRYLHSAGVKHQLGTVIIRTDANTDPLRDKVTITGAGANARPSLRAFKDYWNNNPSIVGTTHDLAVYHVNTAPSGLAYVDNVGTPFRYTTCGGRSADSWARGTAAHEIGHLWSLDHTSSSGLFYELRPRDNAGSTTASGNRNFISIMHGSGTHNIARLATNEARRVIAARDRKRSVGDLISRPNQVRPFGVYDEFFVSPNARQSTFDVISNDYDVNNDVLDVQLLDVVSFEGGRISLSPGTGPGGRNELTYIAPSNGFSGTDFFHYTVEDGQGGSDFGTVYITQYDFDGDQFLFDTGTSTSPIESGYVRVTNQTRSSVYGWTNIKDLGAIDRGVGNPLNRDIIHSRLAKTFEASVKNGLWEVLITFGDASYAHDEMQVSAEGQIKLRNVSTSIGQHINQAFDVNITDGKLSLEFSDQGGADEHWAINRIVLTKKDDPCPTLGQSCNDGDACTINDVIDTNCNCTGTFQDSDGDGICDADEVATGIDADLYLFDLGTETSPLEPGYLRLSNRTQNGSYGWTDINSLFSIERSTGNNISRDLVYSRRARTFEVSVANGTWEALVTFGDNSFSHDAMQVSAEGEVKASNINATAGNPVTEKFLVNVADGKLSLEFSDLGGTDANWVVTRIVLTKKADPCPTVGQSCNDGDACTVNDAIDDNCNCIGTFQDSDGDGICDADEVAPGTGLQDQYLFDAGTETSPLLPGYLRLTERTQNSTYGWTDTNGLFSLDRKKGNELNRDLIYSRRAKTFETAVRNGLWEVVITFGDADYIHDQMQVSAEGEVKLSGISTAIGQHRNQTFDVNVADGRLTLQFSDQGGSDANWTINRIILTKKENDCSEFDSENFESGWGIWNDGGEDASRASNDQFSVSGTRSVRLRDNSGNASSMFTDRMNLTAASTMDIAFSFIPQSMEQGEDFFLEVSSDGGNTYSTVQSWISGTNMTNGTRINATVAIPRSAFSANTVLRMRCDASTNSDMVFIDDVKIAACGQVSVQAPESSVQNRSRSQQGIEDSKGGLSLFPNPAHNIMNIVLKASTDQVTRVQILSTDGQLLRDLKNVHENTLEINVKDLKSEAAYIVRVETSSGYRYYERFVKI